MTQRKFGDKAFYCDTNDDYEGVNDDLNGTFVHGKLLPRAWMRACNSELRIGFAAGPLCLEEWDQYYTRSLLNTEKAIYRRIRRF
jgi:hypothetical protein